MVMAIHITEASAKVRDEGAVDEAFDHDLDVWAGVLEIETHAGRAVKNEDCKASIETPQSIINFKFKNQGVKGR